MSAPSSETTSLEQLTPKDFASDQEVRWCPGCGDYSILAQVKKIMPLLNVPKENVVFVSGIGCASRFPYYMNTYGIHGIHGRAPAIATGVKVANRKLQVWVVMGDGDALSIGGNHLLHALRRNVDLKMLLFNNRIYGLTKGQYSPTSEFGKRTKSTPFGSLDNPMHPLSVAIGAEATFVARSIDADVKHLADTLQRAGQHKGSAFVEIYQDCNVFNHKAFDYATDKNTRSDTTLYLEHGKPMIFGKERNKGIRLNGEKPEVVEVGNGVAVDDLLIHDERAAEPTLAFLLSRMRQPEFPEPMGVLRAIQQPTYDELVDQQVEQIIAKSGPGSLTDLFNEGDIWEVT